MIQQPPYSILRPRNVLIFLASLGLLMGYQTGNAPLWALGWCAACLTAWSALLSALTLRSPSASRSHPERCFQGEEARVEVRLGANSPCGAFLVALTDEFPPAGGQRIHSLFPGMLGRGREALIAYRGQCHRHRGLYVLGPVRLESSDPLGLFNREELLPAFTTLLVYPQASEWLGCSLLEEGVRRHAGAETVRRAGRSEEFIGLRDYRRGDSPRRIHWPSTARHRRLLVKEFQDERSTEASIFLDMGKMGLTGIGDQTTAEYAIQAASVLAREAFRKDHAFQLVAIGEQIERLPLGRGFQHLLALLDRLVFLKPDGERSFAREVLEHRHLIARGSAAALIFSVTTLDIDLLAPVIESLRESAVRVLIVLVDDRTFPKIFQEQERSHLEAASMDQAVMQLRLLGAMVYVLARHPNPAEGVRQGLAIERYSAAVK